MKVSFVGDVMLGRFVREEYEKQPYTLVRSDVYEKVKDSDFVVANLESPLTDEISKNSLAFAGNAQLLDELKWINLFSLSNNHINDFGEKGISDTIASLDSKNILHNGVYLDSYEPFLLERDGCKMAIVTCTDMLNYELGDNCKYNVLRADDIKLNGIINKYSSAGYYVILFAHCGSLFARFPNPQIRNILNSSINAGAKFIVTCHSHCLGGLYTYNNVPVFYSLGDFLMDGCSYRRRKACILTLEFENNQLLNSTVTPVMTNKKLQVILPDNKIQKRILKKFQVVSDKIQNNRKDYAHFYKYQYKKEMIYHSLSTLHFLYDTKGFRGFVRILKRRYREVRRMIHRMIFDRSKMRYDNDAVGTTLKNSDLK